MTTPYLTGQDQKYLSHKTSVSGEYIHRTTLDVMLLEERCKVV